MPAAHQRSPNSTAPSRDHQGEAFCSLLRSLAGLLATHQQRAHGAAGKAVLAALVGLVTLMRRHLAAPERQLVQLAMGEHETGLRLEPPAEPPVKALPPAPAPTLEQQRAQAAIDADLAIKGLAMTARELELLAPHSPRAAQLAAGLRALLASPAGPQLGPGHLALTRAAFEAIDGLSEAQEQAAWAEEEAADLDTDEAFNLRQALDRLRVSHMTIKHALARASYRLTGQAENTSLVAHAAALRSLAEALQPPERREQGATDEINEAHRAWTAD